MSNLPAPAKSPREMMEELEETVRQQKELLVPVHNLKCIGLSPQETRFVLCLFSSPTRIRTEAQLIAAVNGGVDRETDRGANYLNVVRHHIHKKLGDKIMISRVRDIGWEIAEASVEWLKTVVKDLAINGHQVYSVKNIIKQHIGEKRPLSHWNHQYPGALPYKLTPKMVIVLELMMRGPVTLDQIMAATGWERKTARMSVHHMWTRCMPSAFILRLGPHKGRTYQIHPTYRTELVGGFRLWWARFEKMYDVSTRTPEPQPSSCAAQSPAEPPAEVQSHTASTDNHEGDGSSDGRSLLH